MFKKGDRVRHIDKMMFDKYGVLQIWEIKNGNAVCRYGDFSNFGVVTVAFTEIPRLVE